MKTAHEIRVIFFSFGILEQGGGFENYLLATTRGLADRYQDLKISIVTMNPEIVERLQRVLSIYFLKKQSTKAIYRESRSVILDKLGDIPYKQAASLSELATILKQQDLIYAKNEILEMTVLAKIGFRRLPPVIVGVHTTIHYAHAASLSAKLHNMIYSPLIYGRLLKRTESVEVNNTDDLQLVRDVWGLENAKLVRQPFELPPRKPGVFHKGKLRLLFVGRFSEQKGIDVLVAIVRFLQHELPDGFHLKIAGTGEPAIIDQVTQLTRLVLWVEYLGHVPNDKIADLYDWTDVTVIPSRYETLSKVAIETAIAQKVAVATDIPGPRDVIQNGVTGYLLPLDPATFADQILRLADMKRDHPDSLATMGAAAYDYVRQTFDADAAYRDLYNDIRASIGNK